MEMIRSAFYFLAVLSALILVHEWGHFVVAKWCKMRVDDFSLFFGPKLICLGKRNGTEYNIRSVPLGGFVKIVGMEPEDMMNGANTLSAINKGVFLLGLDESRLANLNADHVSERVRAVATSAVGPEGTLLTSGREDLNAILLSPAINSDEQKYIQAILDSEDYTPDPNGFNQKPLYQRALTIFAGPFMSFAFSFLLFCVMGFTVGLPSDIKPDNVIAATVDKKPAALAGLKAGDKIVQIDSVPVTDNTNMVDIIHKAAGKTLSITVLRDKERITKQVPTYLGPYDEMVNGKLVAKTGGLIGIERQIHYVWKRYTPVAAIVRGTEIVKMQVQLTFSSIFSKHVAEHTTSIIGIAGQIHKDSKEGPRQVILTAATLSLGLAIVNLFPIPLLDGGHLILMAWEGLRRRKLTSKEVQTTQLVGISIIGVLFLLVTYNDIMRWLVHRG